MQDGKAQVSFLSVYFLGLFSLHARTGDPRVVGESFAGRERQRVRGSRHRSWGVC